MHQTRPCKVCRLRRRKCIWGKNANICNRCSKLSIECIPSDDKGAHEHEEPIAQDGDEEVEGWLNDVHQLDRELQKIEALASGGHRGYLTTDRNNEQQWQLSIVDGHLRLETAIQSLDEMLLYTQASLRYLSPFKGLFNKNAPVHFDSTSISIPLASGIFIQRNALQKSRKLGFAETYYIIDDNSNSSSSSSNAGSPKSDTIATTTTFTATISSPSGCIQPLFDYRSAIEYLVPLYLENKIPYSGLLHVPTFLEYYHNLKDPLSSPITLAICIDALISLHQIIRYSPAERRLLSETFYCKCKSMLFDMYDDPLRNLEILITTSFLQNYLMDVLLNYVEARRLVTVALLSCADLTTQYNKLTPVERVLYQRHRLILEMCNRTFDIYFESKMDYRDNGDCNVELETLDDEPEKTKEFVKLYNHILRFVSFPLVSIILGQINRIFYGEPCELYLEDILQYKPAVLEWWNSLPSELRLCGDPFDPTAYKLVERKVPPTRLLPFITVHMLTGVISASLLHPRFTHSSGNPITVDVLQSVRNELAALTANSNKVMVYALKGNWLQNRPDSSPSFCFCIIAQILYGLDKLASCADVKFPVELLGMFKKTFNTKVRPLFPPGHEVPSSSSLLESYLKNLKESPLQVYEQYPFPGYALLSDIFLTSLSRLDQNMTIA